MNVEAFRGSLLQDGFTVFERVEAPNSSLEEHDHDWEVKTMITAGSFYVHTRAEQTTCREGEVFTLTADEHYTEGASEDGASLLIGRK